jgi:glycine cleavage system H lipoate-binding protein
MFAVHFIEKNNVLLTQLLNRVPTEGEELKIKGRKAKVESVKNIDDLNIHVQVTIEVVKQNKLVVDNSKKKKR